MADEKVVLVTGASDGLGKSLVKDLAGRGAAVAFCGRTRAKLDLVQQELAGRGATLYCEAFDVRQRDAVSAFVRAVHAKFGRIDALVNNAGVMYLAPVAEMASADILEMVDVNLTAPMHFTTEVLPILRAQRSGDILNVSSISARILGPGVVVYSTTKLALDNFTEGLRREVADTGIRVMSLHLGAVATDLNDKIKHDGMRRLIKMRQKTYTPLDVADVVDAIAYMLFSRRQLCVADMFLVPSAQAL